MVLQRLFLMRRIKDITDYITTAFLLQLSILAEAAGPGTSTHRQLLTVLPSIRTQNETRMLYGTAFGSLLVKSKCLALMLVI